LLTEGRIGDFHTELELIPEKEHSEMYIKFSVELERDIMEGRYNKVFLSKSNAPAETFLFFVEKLMGAVRSEVADCIEASYEKLSIVEAAKILMFPAANTDFDSFVDSVRNECRRRVRC
jgi:26S proteasome regulatory subunit N12